MKNLDTEKPSSEIKRSIALYIIISAAVLLFTLPGIFRLAGDYDHDAAVAYLLRTAALLAGGILITRKLSRAYSAYGFITLGICNLLYILVIGYRNFIYIESKYIEFSHWMLDKERLLDTFIETSWLLIAMNGFLILFSFWLKNSLKQAALNNEKTP